MRLIDADAVIRVLKGFRPMIPYDKELRKALGDKVEGYLEAERIIRSAPTIDAVSVVHGEWIDRSDGGRILNPWWETYECNKCGQYGTRIWNFCPNCGARMKGADDE